MPQVSLWVWLGVVVVATVVELMTLDMTSIWFAFSGIITPDEIEEKGAFAEMLYKYDKAVKHE